MLTKCIKGLCLIVPILFDINCYRKPCSFGFWGGRGKFGFALVETGKNIEKTLTIVNVGTLCI